MPRHGAYLSSRIVVMDMFARGTVDADVVDLLLEHHRNDVGKVVKAVEELTGKKASNTPTQTTSTSSSSSSSSSSSTTHGGIKLFPSLDAVVANPTRVRQNRAARRARATTAATTAPAPPPPAPPAPPAPTSASTSTQQLMALAPQGTDVAIAESVLAQLHGDVSAAATALWGMQEDHVPVATIVADTPSVPTASYAAVSAPPASPSGAAGGTAAAVPVAPPLALSGAGGGAGASSSSTAAVAATTATHSLGCPSELKELQKRYHTAAPCAGET